MLIVTWNLAGRVKRLSEQAKLLLGLTADVHCLQELTRSTLPAWIDLLTDAGYHLIVAPNPGPDCARPLHVLTAAREPLRQVAIAAVPWPERVLAVRTHDGSEIVNVHSPTSPKPNLAKVRTHEAVRSCPHIVFSAAGPGKCQPTCGHPNPPCKPSA